jgi:hypothetical protein
MLVPEAHKAMVAYLEILRWRCRRVEAYRGHGFAAMNLFDLTVLNHITLYEVMGLGGTRQQTLIELLNAPRSTTRGSISQLRQAGLIDRSYPDQMYHPTPKTIDFISPAWVDGFDILCRFSDAVQIWRDAVGGKRP